MLQRTFGKTGIQVSALGMGCMRFERPDALDDMAAIVLRAFEHGVNYFDTAPYYCQDKSEIIVGRAVREMKKSGRPFYVATKTNRSKPAEVRAELERSLQRLNLDAVDFYHVWCLVSPDELPQRKANGLFDVLRKAKEEGLVRHVCVSTHLVHDQVAAMLDQGEGLFEGMLIGLNAINFTMRLGGVREAARRGMGVVTMNTLGGGLIPDHADTFASIMSPGDHSILDAALRFNLSLPEITVALVGFRNLADVDSAADAVERVRLMPATEIERFKNTVLGSLDNLCTQCNYCRDCPADIPVLRFMEAYNERVLSQGRIEKALNKLKWHWGIPDVTAALEACTECRQCERTCTQHLPILERFETLRHDAAQVAAKKK